MTLADLGFAPGRRYFYRMNPRRMKPSTTPTRFTWTVGLGMAITREQRTLGHCGRSGVNLCRNSPHGKTRRLHHTAIKPTFPGDRFRSREDLEARSPTSLPRSRTEGSPHATRRVS
jgi:hypothetical protein